MKLLCLNCGEGFTIDESAIGVDGATVKCVHCAQEQPLFARRRPAAAASVDTGGSGNLANPLAPPPTPVADTPRQTPSGGFCKPMSAMWAGQKQSEPELSAAVDAQTIKMAPPEFSDSSTMEMAPPVDDGSVVLGGLGGGQESSIDMSGGPFIVHSPAALALEFPDFQVMDEWARSIEKLEKYVVSDSSGVRLQLGEFLRRRKQGGRIAAVKAAMRTTGELRNDTITDVLVGKGPVNRPTSMTQQFEFKVVEEKKTGPNKAVVLGVLGAIVVLGVLAAALIFYFS